MEYEVSQLQTQGTPLKETPSGKATIVRQYQVILHPEIMKIQDDKELLEHFKKETIVQLWKDELEPIEELRLVRNLHDPRIATIFAVCHAKQGSLLHLTPKTLDETIKSD